MFQTSGSHYHYGPCFFFRLPPPQKKNGTQGLPYLLRLYVWTQNPFSSSTTSTTHHNPTKEQLFKQLTSPETNRWTVKLRSRISFKGTQVDQVIRWGSEHRLVQSCLWRASIIVHAAQAFDLSIQLGWFLAGRFCDVYGIGWSWWRCEHWLVVDFLFKM